MDGRATAAAAAAERRRTESLTDGIIADDVMLEGSGTISVPDGAVGGGAGGGACDCDASDVRQMFCCVFDMNCRIFQHNGIK